MCCKWRIGIGVLCVRSSYWLNLTVAAYVIVLGVAHLIFKHEPVGHDINTEPIESEEPPRRSNARVKDTISDD